MEKLSPIAQHMQVPLDLPLPPWLQDHRFMGKAVFPAVEAMRILAESAQSLMPKIHVRHILKANFDKFLMIPPDRESIPVFHQMEIRKETEIVSKLITRIHSEKTGITRVKEHVTLHFSADEGHPKPENINSQMPETVNAKGRFEIPCEQVYAQLVPFGPAYQNITGSLILTEKEAVANVQGRPVHLDFMTDFSHSPLGSPFPADAAFHAACAWGQRYAGVVAFPVGLKARHIIRPTSMNEYYKARCIPIKYDAQLLVFDIYLYDQRGNLREITKNLQMQDISRGRMKVPGWVRFDRNFGY